MSEENYQQVMIERLTDYGWIREKGMHKIREGDKFRIIDEDHYIPSKVKYRGDKDWIAESNPEVMENGVLGVVARPVEW